MVFNNILTIVLDNILINSNVNNIEMDIEQLTKLTMRDKQVYAAKCLYTYCGHFNIVDDSIDTLIEHLYAIKVVDDLSKWESIGAKLELTGRGDPLPDLLLTRIPKERLAEFSLLHEYVVEVGLADMYGADSKQPFEYLLKCIEILQKNTIALPVYPNINNEIKN